MKYINIEKFGDLDVLKIRQCEIPKLKKDYLLLKVKAAGINRADIL